MKKFLPSLAIAPALAVLFLATGAAESAAQRPASGTHHETTSTRTWRHIAIHGAHHVEVRATGAVEYDEEGSWVRSLAPGATVVVEERRDGTTRLAEFRRSAGGGVEVVHSVNGRARPLDADARRWITGLLGTAVRNSGAEAEQRVAQIRARDGVAGVLREIERLESDPTRKRYYAALLGGERMRDADFVRTVRHAGSTLRSDVELRHVLRAAARTSPPAAGQAAVYETASGMNSDVERRLVLRDALQHGTLAQGAVRNAFFRATGQMRSDVERRLVLRDALQTSPSSEVTVAALESAAQMRSDVEKRLVLSSVQSAQLRDPRVTAAYRRVVEGMRSDAERSRALRHLAGGGR